MFYQLSQIEDFLDATTTDSKFKLLLAGFLFTNIALLAKNDAETKIFDSVESRPMALLLAQSPHKSTLVINFLRIPDAQK